MTRNKLWADYKELGLTEIKWQNATIANLTAAIEEHKAVSGGIRQIETQAEVSQSTVIGHQSTDTEDNRGGGRVEASSEVAPMTCANCPYFRGLGESDGRGVCCLKDKVARSHWVQTKDCQLMIEAEEERINARQSSVNSHQSTDIQQPMTDNQEAITPVTENTKVENAIAPQPATTEPSLTWQNSYIGWCLPTGLKINPSRWNYEHYPVCTVVFNDKQKQVADKGYIVPGGWVDIQTPAIEYVTEQLKKGAIAFHSNHQPLTTKAEAIAPQIDEVDYLMAQEAKHERDFGNNQELESYSQQANLQQRYPEACDDEECFLCARMSLSPKAPRWDNGGWLMPSKSQSGVRYKTTLEGCSCPAGANGKMCHHRQTLLDLICPVCGRKPGEPPFDYGDEVEAGGRKGKVVSDSPGVQEVGVLLEGDRMHQFFKYSEVRRTKKAPKQKQVTGKITAEHIRMVNRLAAQARYGNAVHVMAGGRAYR